ncbi:hypothetical protein HPB50_005593 [Hyalomma asiaticum]|uniref:Uncharacterized protein n=1 Tax=Hyalomma asiaticum TaxID=266040 RepID=A0ACB7S0G3_HYAAI|nr:hypothetical protein HPB50_005593 [Hyalomma asiaticum]
MTFQQEDAANYAGSSRVEKEEEEPLVARGRIRAGLGTSLSCPSSYSEPPTSEWPAPTPRAPLGRTPSTTLKTNVVSTADHVAYAPERRARLVVTLVCSLILVVVFTMIIYRMINEKGESPYIVTHVVCRIPVSCL